MLYQNDLQPAPTLHLTGKNAIEIAVPEDISHALVQIRTTGPGGDGTPAEVHIVRNGGLPLPTHPLGSIRGCLRGRLTPQPYRLKRGRKERYGWSAY